MQNKYIRRYNIARARIDCRLYADSSHENDVKVARRVLIAFTRDRKLKCAYLPFAATRDFWKNRSSRVRRDRNFSIIYMW